MRITDNKTLTDEGVFNDLTDVDLSSPKVDCLFMFTCGLDGESCYPHLWEPDMCDGSSAYGPHATVCQIRKGQTIDVAGLMNRKLNLQIYILSCR